MSIEVAIVVEANKIKIYCKVKKQKEIKVKY